MSQLPIQPLSPEEQQKLLSQLYLLCGKQVQSYHKQRHMGANSSVPAELAQELLESIEYTVNQVGGIYAHGDWEKALRLGQAVLENKHKKAIGQLELVMATAPSWQTECRWEAVGCLRRYLDSYDYRHLAHKGPDELFYPILLATPDGIQGIDTCLFYLNILWIENQIMAGVSEEALEQFCSRLPAETLNPCEPLLINGIGKMLLDAGLDSLLLAPEDCAPLLAALLHATESTLRAAADRLSQWLNLKDEGARQYVQAVVPQLAIRLQGGTPPWDMENLFLWSTL